MVEAEVLGVGIYPRLEFCPSLGRIGNTLWIIENACLISMEGSKISFGQHTFLNLPERRSQLVCIGYHVFHGSVEQIQIHSGLHPLSTDNHCVDGTNGTILLRYGFIEVSCLIPDNQIDFNAVLTLKILSCVFKVVREIPGIERYLPFILGSSNYLIPTGCLQVNFLCSCCKNHS